MAELYGVIRTPRTGRKEASAMSDSSIPRSLPDVLA